MREMTRVPLGQMAVLNRRVWNDISDPWQDRREREFDWRYFRRGGTALSAEVHRMMGPVRGKSLLDLQCGSGEAALSWAIGGARVTGLDISERRLVEARRKAELANLRVTYKRGDVVRLPFRPGSFDRVYTGGGVTAWIPDVRRWGVQIARVLRPGGKFLYWDRHPFTLCLVERAGRLVLGNERGGYFDSRPLAFYGMARWMKRPGSFRTSSGTGRSETCSTGWSARGCGSFGSRKSPPGAGRCACTTSHRATRNAPIPGNS